MDIDERTRIPLFIVLGTLPFALGGILWLTSIDSKASSAKEQIADVRAELSEIKLELKEKKTSDIRYHLEFQSRLIRIESKLDSNK